MLVETGFIKERVPFKALLKLKALTKNSDFIIVYLPPNFNPYAAYSILKKISNNLPFLALYVPYVGINKISSEFLGVAAFKFESPKTKITIKVSQDVFSLVEYLSRKNEDLILLFLTQTSQNFLENFSILEKNIRTSIKILGMTTGVKPQNGQNPLITNHGLFFDNTIVSLHFYNFKVKHTTVFGFKSLGPYFKFTATNAIYMDTIENLPATKFFKNILKKAQLPIEDETLTAFSLALGLKKKHIWHIRHPKRFVEDKIEFWGPLPKEGKFKFGVYTDVENELNDILNKDLEIWNSYEFTFIFNCVGKRYSIEPKYEFENFMKKVQIPINFLGSFGEIASDQDGILHYLNGSMNIVALKEKK